MQGPSSNSRLDICSSTMNGLHKVPRSQQSSPSCQNYYSDDDYDLFPPSGTRLAPVGAASNEDEDIMASKNLAASSSSDFSSTAVASASTELEERLRQMEEDQEELNSSLMSLTSHFAKVRRFFY